MDFSTLNIIINMIIPEVNIIEKVLGYLINPSKKIIEQKEICYILISDSKGYFNNLIVQKSLNFYGKEFTIQKINYVYEFEIDDDEIFDEITDDDYVILLYYKGKNFIKEKFEIFEEDTIFINFSILDCINSIFKIDPDIEIKRKIKQYSEHSLQIEIFHEFYEAFLFFEQDKEELKTIRNIKSNIFFNLLLLFFSNRLFSPSYNERILKKIKSQPSRVLFDVSSPQELIEMLFYLKPNYNSDLLRLIFHFLPPANPTRYNVILNLVKKIFKSNNYQQSLLKYVFIINLFRLTCGRSSFCLGESDLQLFNNYSNNALSSIFESDSFCTFSDYYIELCWDNEFWHFLKTRYLRDFEIYFKLNISDFDQKFIHSIDKKDIFDIDAQTFLFEVSYNSWRKKFCEIIFYELIDEVIKKLKNKNYNFNDIQERVTVYKRNLLYMENFIYFKDIDKTLFENLLTIMEKDLEIFEKINNNNEKNLEFWLKNNIVESIYEIEKKFRIIKDIYVDLDHEDPIYKLLKERIEKNDTTLYFIEFFNGFFLENFFDLIKANYQELITGRKRSSIKFTKDIIEIIKEDFIKENVKIILIIADCLRYDFWDSISKRLIYELNLNIEKRERIISLIPSTTCISRGSIFFPEITTEIHTVKQIESNLKNEFSREDVKISKFGRIKDIPSAEIQKELDLNMGVNVIIASYPDHRIHQIENVNELYRERSYNQIKNQIKDHLYSIFNAIVNSINKLEKGISEYKIILTSDHGFIDYYNGIDLTISSDIKADIEPRLKSRYIKCSDKELKKLNLNKKNEKNLLKININNNQINYIISKSRYFFQVKSKSLTKINHGGISYYENIIPFASYRIGEIKRSLFKPRLIFKKEKNDLFKFTTNQISFTISNEDSFLPIFVKSVSVITDNEIIKFDPKFTEEEGLLLPNSFSENFNFQYEDNRDEFKLYYKIVYSFYSDDDTRFKTEIMDGEENFEQLSFQNPIVKFSRLDKDDMIKGNKYAFQIEVENPNDIIISQIKINLNLGTNNEFSSYNNNSVKLESNQIKIDSIEKNQKISLVIFLVFNERCKTDLMCDGKFSLPNSQSTRFKGKSKYIIDVFESEDALNLERSFKLK